MNYLHLGDCYDVLHREISPESADLIYIDPPFQQQAQLQYLF